MNLETLMYFSFDSITQWGVFCNVLRLTPSRRLCGLEGMHCSVSDRLFMYFNYLLGLLCVITPYQSSYSSYRTNPC